MKKIIAILIICLVMFCCGGCQVSAVENVSTSESSMFVIVENTDFWKIVYHKETKVMYVVSKGSYNSGNFTLMVDEEGKPLLWQGE